MRLHSSASAAREVRCTVPALIHATAHEVTQAPALGLCPSAASSRLRLLMKKKETTFTPSMQLTLTYT